MLEYIRHLEELQIDCIYDKREFRIVLLRFRILEGGGGIENFKNLQGGHRKFTNNHNRGPVKILAFFKTSYSPSPPPSA